MVTNLERMKMGHPPIDPISGKAYELHHVGQSIDSPLAILTKVEHMQGGNNTILLLQRIIPLSLLECGRRYG